MNQIQKVNYQLELDKIIKKHQDAGERPTLLLHSCCGPCSSYVVSYLCNYFELTVLFYNPNIYPQEEYDHRLAEQARLLKEFNIPLLTVPYDHYEFLEAARGLEMEPEGGKRCRECFAFRLKKTQDIAASKGFDYYCTTLSVSPHKNSMVINEVGRELASDVSWLPSDFKKKEGYKQSIELSKKYNLYRQEYCGCEYAMRASSGDNT